MKSWRVTYMGKCDGKLRIWRVVNAPDYAKARAKAVANAPFGYVVFALYILPLRIV